MDWIGKEHGNQLFWANVITSNETDERNVTKMNRNQLNPMGEMVEMQQKNVLNEQRAFNVEIMKSTLQIFIARG